MNRATHILIRDICERDLGTITEIYAHHVLNGLASFEETPPDKDEMAARYKAILAGGYPYIVAESDGEVLGYAYAAPYRSRPAYRYSVENSIYIAPHMTGCGIGGVLLQATIKACEDRNYHQMIAIIGDSANQASIALHERYGFTLTGVLKDVGYKHNRWVDSVIMQRPLNKN